jgi:hypothetical protein
MNNRPKTGGRTKGTPNRLTSDIKPLIADFVSGELEHLMSNIAMMPDDKRTDVLLRLLPYVVPKAQPVDATNTTDPRKLVLIVSDKDIE